MDNWEKHNTVFYAWPPVNPFLYIYQVCISPCPIQGNGRVVRYFGAGRAGIFQARPVDVVVADIAGRTPLFSREQMKRLSGPLTAHEVIPNGLCGTEEGRSVSRHFYK